MKSLSQYIKESSNKTYKDYLKQSFKEWKGQKISDVIPSDWECEKDNHYDLSNEIRYIVTTRNNDELSVYCNDKNIITSIEFND